MSLSAATLTVSVSGQFSSGVIADEFAAPGATWALSFNVDSNPVAANTDAFSFDAPFSNFSYLLNGSAIAVSPESIRFFASDDSGLFTVFFGPETGFFNGMPIPEFSFSGDQVFSGMPSSPTIIPGVYPISDVTYSDALNFDDEGASGAVTVTGAQSSVPEPSSFWLCLAAVVVTLFVRIGGAIKRSASAQTKIRFAPVDTALAHELKTATTATGDILAQKSKAASPARTVADKIRWWRRSCAVTLLCTSTAISSRGQTFTTLASFNGTDGAAPWYGSLVQGTDGNLYGLTNQGGVNGVFYGAGTFFKVSTSGTLTALYSFSLADGGPYGGVIQASDGNFYGTTLTTVFKVTPGGALTTLYGFCATCGLSYAGVIQASDGNFYGTTWSGGTNNAGTIFKVTPGGAFTAVYNFCSQANCADGSAPLAPLLQASDGNFYGTTSGSGVNGSGTIFRITPGGIFTVLNSPDGNAPAAGALIQATDGNLYGTTGGGSNYGTVFRITLGGKATTLYSFCAVAGCADGNSPFGGLLQATDGNLYGTTDGGGEYGYGSVFRITPGGTLATLHSFSGVPPDGAYPLAGLVQASDGNLYGTTEIGGAYTDGTVFSLIPGELGKLLGQCGCPMVGEPPGEPAVGQPITVSTGNMFEQATDYTTAGQNPLGFIRYYNSQGNAAPVTTLAVSLGANWRSSYDRYLNIASATSVIAERADGQQLTFTLNGGTWTSDSDVDLTLTNAGSTWILTDHNDTTETYTAISSTEAQLRTTTSRNGYTQVLAYNSSNQLILVTDSYARTLSFTYTGSGLLQSITTPDANTVTYGYTATGGGNVLTSATYSTTPATTITYLYQNAGLPFALTGIIDEDGNHYAAWTYDSSGRALTSQLGAGVNLTTLVYNSDGSRTVTSALGVTDTYKFTTLQGVPKVTEIDRAATATTSAATELFTYDANGYTASQTDWNGNQTTYVNDAHGDPSTINEAVGTAVARTTTIAYDSTFVHLPHSIATPGLTVNLTYDGSGELLTKTLTDTTTTALPYATNGQARSTSNTWSNFLLASSTTSNGNTTSFTYDASGELVKITKALNQVTNITAHTGGGLPQTIVDPNGVTTTFAYDARQRLLTSTVTTSQGPRTTTYTYDAAGNLTKTTLPDGSALANTYDTAHRLTTITDLFHQTVAYMLDALGDRTRTNLTAVGNRIQRQHTDTFDALGRVLADTGGVGQVTAFAYDPDGNALTVTDPLGRVTSRTFDALNRLSRSTDPATGVTTTTYDAHDRVLSITDPNGNATTYVYDGFGDLIQQLSPDSGKTIYHYDADSNLTSKADAEGNITNNTYDALDRILTTTYPADTMLNVAYNYDQAAHGFGVGRLTSLTDAAGSLSRSYDERGNLLIETRVNGTTTLQTVYTYDPASRVASITYPSGWTVSQTRDIMGRIFQLPVAAPGGASTSNAIANATYEPFGPLYTLSYGNGINETRHFDLDYRVTTLADTGTSAIQGLGYAYDQNDNVTAIADAVTPNNSQSLGYDVLNRLTSATGAYGSLGYTYDLLGNRLTQALGGVTTTYGYTVGTNRLASITAGGSMTPVSYTATGSISSIPPTTSAPVATLNYSAANRLASVSGTVPAITGMAYDAFGKRISKTDPGSYPILYTYDQNGNLLEEADGHGLLVDYVYLNGRPVAGITGGHLYYLHTDRLGTPQLATDSGQNVAWKTMYQPFGQTSIPVGSISQNLRFPGQYADGETGWNYNGFRDYDPTLGRYVESDPIALAAGLNLYAYAGGNPMAHLDTTGLLCSCTTDTSNSFLDRWQDAFDRAEQLFDVGQAIHDILPKAITSGVALNFLYSNAILKSYLQNGLFGKRLVGAAISDFGGPLVLAYYSKEFVAGIAATLDATSANLVNRFSDWLDRYTCTP